MSNFRKALMFTAVPPVLLLIVFVILGLLDVPYSSGPEVCLILVGILAVTAFVSSIVLVIRHKRGIAKGMGIGGGIGLVTFIIGFALAYAFGYG